MWVAEHCAQELRNSLGSFDAGDWNRCAKLLNLRIRVADLPAGFPAFLYDGTMFLCASLTNDELTSAAWHEIAHHVMHVGDIWWWRSRPQGEITVRRMERQAQDFVSVFPIWE